MKKNTSYRDKLLELSKIYKISDVQSYIKNKKYLTTAQIEHILKKNKVPIPTEINKSILEIHSKKITRPINNLGNSINNYLIHLKNQTIKFIFLRPAKNIKGFFIFILNSFLKFWKWINKTIINILNNAYNFKVEEKKANKVVAGTVAFTFIFLILIGGNQVRNIMTEQNEVKINLNENKNIKTQKKIVKIPEKKSTELKEKKAKAPKKDLDKSAEKIAKAPTKSKKVKEFVLPDLNLKTETVLALFNDVEYDLKKVRREKLVKPIYFTQFPKDLDEISSIKLKKETFIKIVLPLVVAENQKILDDRRKFKIVSKKKMTNEKEKLWLRQKFKEYKVTNGSVAELDTRMDIIPISIAIAQAAKESGWGTSRFALEGNAIFGQWTWSGSGIAPLDRTKAQSHKVLRFPILRASVKAYKNNLNTHKSYKEFRDKRKKLRTKNKSIEGIKLIHTLESYAQTGSEYTKVLAQMMQQNSLDEFENVKLTNSVIKKQLNL